MFKSFVPFVIFYFGTLVPTFALPTRLNDGDSLVSLHPSGLVARDIECDDIKEVQFWYLPSFSGKKVDGVFHLLPIGGGADGCVYIPFNGDLSNPQERLWPTGERVIVKIEKEPAQRVKGRFVRPVEATVLEFLHKLFHTEVVALDDLEPHNVIVMKREEGKRLIDTEEWRNFFGWWPRNDFLSRNAPPRRVRECMGLLAHIHNVVAKAVLDLANQGVYHNDYHYENILFSDDLSTATLIDFGRAVAVSEVDGGMASIRKEVQSTVEGFQLPFSDTTGMKWPGIPDGPSYSFQGICQSDKREGGAKPNVLVPEQESDRLMEVF